MPNPLRFTALLCLLGSVLLLVACTGSTGSAPIDSREAPPSRELWLHYVTTGETLYSIAFRYEKDFRELARINSLDSSYTIHRGQKLYLTADAARRAGIVPAQRGSSAPATIARPTTAPPAVVSTPPGTSAPTSRPTSPPLSPALTPVTPDKWTWPHSGSIVRSFGSGDPVSKGIQIAASEGSDVLAAMDGVVVYAGAGLRGYGNLLIIKHDDSHLSAYAYNRELIAKEDDLVRAGQKIATVGTDTEGNNRLYFEIRLDGVPVDPIRYLPRR